MNGGGAVGHKYSIPGSNVSFQPDNQPLGRSAVFVDQCVMKRYSEDRIGMVDYALESGGVSSSPPFAGPPCPTLTGPLASAGAAMVLSKQGLRSAEISQPRTHHKGE